MMNNSLGIIEIKGFCATISALDNLLKNSEANFDIEETHNGNFILKITGNFAEVKHAVNLTADYVNKISSVLNISLIEKMSGEIESLFWNNRSKKNIKPEKESLRTNSLKKQKSLNILSDGTKKEKAPKSHPESKTTIDDEIIKPSAKQELNTIEKLRLEALGKSANSLYSKEKNSKKDFSFKVETLADLEVLNVHKLRRAARDFENFPIKGRQISKANRDELIEYFKLILPA